ncbi:MAG: hypothetical protein N2376_05815, partial [Clostridia bacterium]|nr:hypothetical protein [Clostridia bacterium]
MKKLNKLVSGLIIGGIILSTGTVAMAAGTKTTGQHNAANGRTAIAGKMLKGGDKGAFGKGFADRDISTDLKALVSAGTITQGEADKIQALATQQAAARQAEMDKIKAMTDAERKAYFDASKTQAQKPADIYTQAVTNGIITQAKADAIKAKLHELREAAEKT